MAEPIATVGDLAGICGHDGTNWEKILIDASKRLVVAVASVVANDAQIHGYIDGAWQKQPLQFGFSDIVVEDVRDTNAAAGNNSLLTTEVPAGEVHVYNSVYVVDNNNNPTSIFIQVVYGGTSYNHHREAGPGAGVSVENTQPLVLPEGGRVKALLQGCTAGDTIIMNVIGYKFDVDL